MGPQSERSGHFQKPGESILPGRKEDITEEEGQNRKGKSGKILLLLKG